MDFISLEYIPFQKVSDMFFKKSEVFPLCEIVASLHALFLPLHICAGILYMGSVQKKYLAQLCLPYEGKVEKCHLCQLH